MECEGDMHIGRRGERRRMEDSFGISERMGEGTWKVARYWKRKRYKEEDREKLWDEGKMEGRKVRDDRETE